MRDIPPRTAAVIVALALIAGLVSGGQGLAPSVSSVAEPAARTAEARRSAQVEGMREAANLDDLDLDHLQRRERAERVPDLFASTAPPTPPARRVAMSALPPPLVAAAPPEAAPRPVAPQIPFRYLGHLVEEAKTSVFLERNQETLSVPIGETIAGTYKVESITDKAVVFVYLPLGERQTLPIPARQ